MIYFYCTSWQFFQMIVKWRISPTTEQIMFTFSILLFHFYSHIPCGMWLSYIWSIKITKIISTHTSRVGCDILSNARNQPVYISTHTSRVGCDDASEPVTFCSAISTHTSRVGCDDILRYLCDWHIISTHTSRVGCDHRQNYMWLPLRHFYSHIPCGMWLST